MGKTPVDDAVSSDDESSYEMLVATPTKREAIVPEQTAETLRTMELENELLKKENGLLETKINDIIYVLCQIIQIVLITAVSDTICLAGLVLFFPELKQYTCLAIVPVIYLLVGCYCGYIIRHHNPLECLMKLFPRSETTETTESTSTPPQADEMVGSNPNTTTTEAAATTSAISVDPTNINDADKNSTKPEPTKMEESDPSSVITEASVNPDAPTNNDADMTPRTVTIIKGEDWKWGITWIGFCISSVTPGSSADLNGLRRGDELISTDGVRTDRRNSKGLEIVTHIAEARGTVTLGVRYNPKKLEEEERKKQEEHEANEKERREDFIVLAIIAVIAAFVFALYSMI